MVLYLYDLEQILYLRMLCLCFQAVTSLKVNVNKSEMVPIGEVTNLQFLAYMLGCKVANLPMSYLGMLLGASYKSSSIWNPILKNFERDWLDGRSCIFQKVVD